MELPSSQCDQRHFDPAGIIGREKSQHSRPDQKTNKTTNAEKNRNPQAQYLKPQLIPVGGFVGFCPPSFTVSVVFHQTEDDLEIVL